MMSAGRLIVDAVDAVVAKGLADAVASEILLRAHETGRNIVCRLLLENKNI